jgi:hypothetical protein
MFSRFSMNHIEKYRVILLSKGYLTKKNLQGNHEYPDPHIPWPADEVLSPNPACFERAPLCRLYRPV